MGFARNDAEQIKVNLVTGAAGATNITLTGLEVGDAIVSVINLTDLAEVSLAGLVISADAFKVTASTATKKLQVVWRDVNAG